MLSLFWITGRTILRSVRNIISSGSRQNGRATATNFTINILFPELGTAANRPHIHAAFLIDPVDVTEVGQ